MHRVTHFLRHDWIITSMIGPQRLNQIDVCGMHAYMLIYTLGPVHIQCKIHANTNAAICMYPSPHVLFIINYNTMRPQVQILFHGGACLNRKISCPNYAKIRSIFEKRLAAPIQINLSLGCCAVFSDWLCPHCGCFRAKC